MRVVYKSVIYAAAAAHECEQLAQGCYLEADQQIRTRDLFDRERTLYHYATQATPYFITSHDKRVWNTHMYR